jgi:hypothetical protein
MSILSPNCDKCDEITKVSAAVRGLPVRPSLRARTFHELDPATDH